jgi:tetrapyrrole methylase family protein/MazG family protein
VSAARSAPTITVVGLGPGAPSHLPEPSRRALLGAERAILRTGLHPSAPGLGALDTFDRLYEEADDFDQLYQRIVDELVAEAMSGRRVVYGVPGSPMVAEATVALLRADTRVTIEILPAPSFLDLAWVALDVDPVASGVQLLDAARCEVEVAGRTGPFLVAQCWSRAVLSRLKLALGAGEEGPRSAVILHHLGLPDEVVVEVPLARLDQALEPDHLTSVFVAGADAPVSAEMARLDELVRTLRERCPWDREQTHGSLARHLVEETYEVLDAISEIEAPPGSESAALAAEHLEEELGDLLFQVFFHSRLASEEGWFTVGDVARGVHDKLVGRHPHVFGDVEAATAGAVMANWEAIKSVEKGRASVTDGIPAALPALLLAAKLERKARSLGIPEPSAEDRRRRLADLLEALGAAPSEEALGDVLYELAAWAATAGLDAEEALRKRSTAERAEIVAFERGRTGTP